MLYRVGRAPDPLLLPPAELVGGGRFDDPRGEYRVLYTGETLQACLLELLPRFRPDLRALAAPFGEGERVHGKTSTIPRYWLASRRWRRLHLEPEQRWLNLNRVEARQLLRVELAPLLVELGASDLDAAAVAGPDRRLTQAVSRLAYEWGMRGIAYPSRLDPARTCWVLFEGAAFRGLGEPAPLLPGDPYLLQVADELRLRVASG